MQAFEFDAALAYRYSLLEHEDHQSDLNFYMNGIRAIIGAVTGKRIKPEKFDKKLGKTTEADRQAAIERLMGFKSTTQLRGVSENP